MYSAVLRVFDPGHQWFLDSGNHRGSFIRRFLPPGFGQVSMIEWICGKRNANSLARNLENAHREAEQDYEGAW